MLSSAFKRALISKWRIIYFDDAVKHRQEMEELLFEPVIAKFNESRMMETDRI